MRKGLCCIARSNEMQYSALNAGQPAFASYQTKARSPGPGDS